MSNHSISDREGSDESDYDEDYAEEFAVLARVPSLPQEIQSQIVSFCDLISLGILCKVNKEWNKKASPHLWCNIDFVETFDDNERIEATRLFFVQCNAMMDSDPERFSFLASRVRTLNLGRLLGINIVQNDDTDYFAYYDTHGQEGKRNVFDVIAQFKNLESLSVYIKSWWMWSPNRREMSEILAKNLTKLKSLKIGGQMPPWSLKGFEAAAPNLKDLTLINLISLPGQDDGPEPVTFLSEDICKRFTRLETLHLCKLADLQPGGGILDQDEDDSDHDSDGGEEYVSGMRWRFPREGEIDVLEEWALLLQHTSKTLRALTLENRYLCSYGWDNVDNEFIEPGKTHPADYGSHSISQSQRVLFPVLFNQEWPRLEELTLVGMGTEDEVSQSVAHLQDRVHVEQSSARFQLMMGDSTPEEISTPVEFMGHWVEGWEVVEEADSDKNSGDGDGSGDEEENSEDGEGK